MMGVLMIAEKRCSASAEVLQAGQIREDIHGLDVVDTAGSSLQPSGKRDSQVANIWQINLLPCQKISRHYVVQKTVSVKNSN